MDHPHICDSVPAMAEAMQLGAHMVEFRLDQMEEGSRENILLRLPQYVDALDFQPILTFRHKDHGGPVSNDTSACMRFWSAAFRNHPIAIHTAQFIDFEDEIVQFLVEGQYKKLNGTEIPWDNVLWSHHDLMETPDDDMLEEILEDAIRSPAGAMKFVFKSNGELDNYRIMRMYELNCRRKPMIAIGYGPDGRETRLRAPELGAVFTFAQAEMRDRESGKPHISEYLRQMAV